jgi:hypothetical protein
VYEAGGAALTILPKLLVVKLVEAEVVEFVRPIGVDLERARKAMTSMAVRIYVRA